MVVFSLYEYAEDMKMSKRKRENLAEVEVVVDETVWKKQYSQI